MSIMNRNHVRIVLRDYKPMTVRRPVKPVVKTDKPSPKK